MIEINIMVYDLDLSNPTSVVRLLRGRMIASWNDVLCDNFLLYSLAAYGNHFTLYSAPDPLWLCSSRCYNYWHGLAKQVADIGYFNAIGKLSEMSVGYSCVIFGDACNYTVRLLLVRPFLFCGVFFCWSVFKICFVTNITAVWKRKPLLLPSRAYQHRSPDDESDDDDNEEDFMNRTFELECGSDISNEN
jgi:hypothetical protein